MLTLRFPAPVPCPFCDEAGTLHAADADADAGPPGPGDLIVCLGCGLVALVTATSLRPFTLDDVCDTRLPDLVELARRVQFFHQAWECRN